MLQTVDTTRAVTSMVLPADTLGGTLMLSKPATLMDATFGSWWGLLTLRGAAAIFIIALSLLTVVAVAVALLHLAWYLRPSNWSKLWNAPQRPIRRWRLGGDKFAMEMELQEEDAEAEKFLALSKRIEVLEGIGKRHEENIGILKGSVRTLALKRSSSAAPPRNEG